MADAYGCESEGEWESAEEPDDSAYGDEEDAAEPSVEASAMPKRRKVSRGVTQGGQGFF